MIPTPSPVKSRPLFSKKAPKKPEPFRASQESRSSQDGRLFYVLVFRDHSPDRDSTGLSIPRSEEHTSELQSLMRISYAVFCLKKKNNTSYNTRPNKNTVRN